VMCLTLRVVGSWLGSMYGCIYKDI